MLEWIKKDLINTNILVNSTEKSEKHCKMIQDEIIQKIQPASHSLLESFYKIRGTLKSKYTLGGDGSICGLGLDLASL